MGAFFAVNFQQPLQMAHIIALIHPPCKPLNALGLTLHFLKSELTVFLRQLDFGT